MAATAGSRHDKLSAEDSNPEPQAGSRVCTLETKKDFFLSVLFFDRVAPCSPDCPMSLHRLD